jgi:hypothetical protein
VLPVTSGGDSIEPKCVVVMVVSSKAMTVNDNDADNGATAGSTSTYILFFSDKIRWDLVVLLLLLLLQMMLGT